MRSEERSGIISIVLFLLWGTLVTEPFRYFVRIISEGLFLVTEKTGMAPHGKLSNLVVTVVLLLITVVLLKMSVTRISNYFAPVFGSISLVVFLSRCLMHNDVDKKEAAILIIALAIVLLVMLTRIERIWIWLADVYILAFPFYIINAWLFKPISDISEKISKYFFVCSKSDLSFAAPYDSFLTLPSIVWGVFFAILMIMPVLYFVVGRRKS